MDSYKKAWRYVGCYKRFLLSSVLFLIIFQLCNSITPLIIQDLLDNKILSVAGSWYQVESSENSANINNLYFSQDENRSDIIQKYTVALIDDQFVATSANLPNEARSLSSGGQIVINDQTYPTIKLTSDQLQSLFSLQKGAIISSLIALAMTMLIGVVATYLQRISGAYLTINVTRDSRLDAVDKFDYIDISFLEDEPAGKTANRILADTMGISQLYNSSVNIFISSILSIVFSFIGMFILNPQIAAICLLIIPIMIIWIKIFTQKINRIAIKVNETNSQIVAKLNEIINGISILKIFNSEKMTLEDFKVLNDEYVDEKMDEVVLHLGQGWNAVNLFQGIVIAAVVGLLAYLNLAGISIVEAGVIYAFYTYITKIIAPLNLLFHEFSNLEHSKVKINRIFRLLDAKEESHELATIAPYEGFVNFEDVSFSYDLNKRAISNFSLEIEAGQKVGLVGRSGSGKSTIINLLMRFNDLKDTDQGHIYVDGVEINSESKRTYRSHIGIILQEPILFQGSLASNIKFGANASDEQIINTLNIIGATPILAKFDNDIHQEITNKGGNLSLGEKQLISLARVLIRNPSILIMDEATANIDTETEAMINYALDVVAKNRTVIIVAHRLSTIRDADQIIVMEDGKMLEKGNHHQLLAKNGKYMEMYRNQVGV